MAGNNSPIGVFDSGIGGLSVANAIYTLLPQEGIHYFADTGRVPYGPRSREEITEFSREITQFLLDQGCKMIVVACNTATAAALEQLRAEWPEVPFVGMEPAVKPAAQATQSGKVGVLATLSTIQSKRYEQLMHRYAAGVEILENPCVGLVSLIESGKLDQQETRELLQSIVNPMVEEEVDTLVLGCTHYPFILPLLRQVAGEHCQIIDPAPAVARQVARRLHQHQLEADADAQTSFAFYASGRHSTLDHYTTIPFQIQAYPAGIDENR